MNEILYHNTLINEIKYILKFRNNKSCINHLSGVKSLFKFKYKFNNDNVLLNIILNDENEILINFKTFDSKKIY